MTAGQGGTAMVCVAQVAAAHGVRGAVKLRCFTAEPESVAAYGPLCDEAGRELFRIRLLGPTQGGMIAQVEGILDRNAAEALRGLRLYVPRSTLPEPEPDEFYHEDLVGLPARDASGAEIGRVTAVLNFGAGDLIELATGDGGSLMLPFTRAAVPEIDLEAGFVVVAPPETVA
ncbi:MAG: ribosome maturation factor RimM [Geminicoccaceae bacterium]